MPGKKFNAAAFSAKVNEGDAKFQQAIADEKFTARRPVLVNLKAQFDADVAHLRSKASRGKITPALATSALGQISDESLAATKDEFQDLLSQAKGDTSELVRQNAEELERRLVLLKKERSTRRTSIFS